MTKPFTINTGTDYYIRIVITHGTSAALYFNGDASALTLTDGGGGSDDYNIGAIANSSGDAEIQLLAWKVGENEITSETDVASDLPWIYQTIYQAYQW